MPELLTVLVLLDTSVEVEAACNPLTRRTPMSEDVVWPRAFIVRGLFELPLCLAAEMATPLPADLRTLVLDVLALLCPLC